MRPVSAPPQPPALRGDIGTNADLLQTRELAQLGGEDLVAAAEVKISQCQGRAVISLMILLQLKVIFLYKYNIDETLMKAESA